MIRSNFAITRLLVLPYAGLLGLFLLVVGGGGAWLFLQVRAVETQLLIDDINSVIEPFVEKLAAVDAVTTVEQGESWLIAYVQDLLAGIPSLREVFVHDQQRGFEMKSDSRGVLSIQPASPLPVDASRASAYAPAAQRLHSSQDAVFLIRFDLMSGAAAPVRLDFCFDRQMMLAEIDKGMLAIEQSILLFGIAGGVSILLAMGITVIAMRTTRRIEGHFQEIYQRASITEMAAELVHDLRNPLMALRTNVKALLVTPDQTGKIIDELDRDIVLLNDKLSAFLSLTRRNEDTFEPADIRGLVNDAIRLANPVLSQHGLRVETDIPPELPRPVLKKALIRDALLNILINAGESGQKDGEVRVKVRVHSGVLTITVDDQGDGIPEEHMAHLFDPYYTTKVNGNGLGLAIVQRNVDVHRGEVQARNRAEGGATIMLRLPLQQKEVPRWWKPLEKISRA